MHSSVLSLHYVHNSLFCSTIVSPTKTCRIVNAKFDTTALLYNESRRGATLQLNNIPNFRNPSSFVASSKTCASKPQYARIGDENWNLIRMFLLSGSDGL
ncbi:unnamed protein product [Spodoptera littoralis]|uniref:Uncharacterized protein n=1 Tax=Spodoptera littoralis TaxID=7109 RepID=A0A9P0N6S2_SPOLI|nr:unnamed protein product [Spodoptera littoralis]CAH1644478.1 unnamed protein product [Spodoptera littoralis]